MVSANAILRTRLVDNWTTTPIAFANFEFDPANPGGSFPANGSWIFWDEIIASTSDQASIGATSNRERDISGIVIDIFTPANEGPGAALDLVEELKDLFRWFQSGGLVTRSLRIISSEKDGEWFKISLFLPYRSDNFKTTN